MINHGKPLGRALVAGGAGFMGRTCDALLAEGCSVTVVDNFCTGRIENLQAPGQRAPPQHHQCRRDRSHAGLVAGRHDLQSGVRRLAAPLPGRPGPHDADERLGTRNLLALADGARFVLASTSEVYGDPEIHPQTESFGNVNPTGPRACYDEGKRAAETLCFDYLRAGRVDVHRPDLNTYGPRMRLDDGRVVSNMITQALGAEDITIYGDGSQTRSFCYADDLVDGLMRLAVYDGPAQPAQPRQPGRDHDRRARGRSRADRLALAGRRKAAARRRSQAPAAGHHARAGGARLVAAVPLKAGLTQTISWFATRPAANGTRMPAAAKLSARSASAAPAAAPPRAHRRSLERRDLRVTSPGRPRPRTVATDAGACAHPCPHAAPR